MAFLELVCGLILGLFMYTFIISFYFFAHLSITNPSPTVTPAVLPLLPPTHPLCAIRPCVNLVCIFIFATSQRDHSTSHLVMTLFMCVMNFLMLFVCNPSIANPGPRSLSVLYNNVRGFVHTANLSQSSPDLAVSKVLEFQDFIYTHKPDVIVINETWLKSSLKSSEIFSNGYKVFRLDRCAATHPFDPEQPKKFRANGGGVLIAHREDISLSSYKFDRFSTQAEILSVVFNCSTNISFCITSFYRVSSLSSDNLSNVKSYLLNLAKTRSFKRHFLVGDFNLPGISWPDGTTNNALESEFVDFLCGELGHSQMVMSPTHVSGNTLDLLFTNCPNLVSQLSVCDVNEVCCSDHYGLRFNINLSFNRSDRPARFRYDFRKFDPIPLNVALGMVNWDRLINDDINESWENVRRVIVSMCEKYIPKKRVRNPFTPSWHDDRDVVRARNRKETLRSRLSGNPSPENKTAYYEARKNLKRVISSRMNAYFDVDSGCGITKRFWSHIKLSSKTLRIPENVFSEGVYRSDPSGKANLFNNHLVSHFTAPSSYGIEVDELENSVFFTYNEVYTALASIDSSKACGDDGIPGRVLKNCAGSLTYPLWLLYNNCARVGIFPDAWKLASIVPVFKKGDRRDVANYRPISLLSLVSKVMEKLVKPRILDLCSPNLDPRQHGFLGGRSCTTQLIPFTHNLAQALDARARVDVVYFDFSRAFDSCNHDLILSKLKLGFGVNGKLLGLIRSYLKGRCQKVVIDGESSDILPVASGVPQGSILGPILFVLFIDDIFNEPLPGTNISLYADDTKIWRRIDSMSDHIALQKSIDALYDWSIRNRMRFHPAKCQVLSVISPTTQSSNPFSNLPFHKYFYSLGGVFLEYVTHQRDLGIVINSTLDFNSHCDSITTSMLFKFNLLRRTCYFLSKSSCKRTLYLSMVRSLVEHCNQVWSCVNVGSLRSLELLQKRAVKWIRNEPLASYTNDEYVDHLLSLNLLPFKQLFEFHSLRLFYKIVYGMISITVPEYIQPVDPSKLRTTRQNIDCTFWANWRAYEYKLFDFRVQISREVNDLNSCLVYQKPKHFTGETANRSSYRARLCWYDWDENTKVLCVWGNG